MIFLRVNIWSVHDHPRRKPACSSQRRWSAAPLSWQSSMVKKAFPLTESRVIPHQFVYSIMLPSFGSLRMTLFWQFSGTASIHQHSLNSFVSTFVTIGPPYFSNSDWISSMPAGLLICLIFELSSPNRLHVEIWCLLLLEELPVLLVAQNCICWSVFPRSVWLNKHPAFLWSPEVCHSLFCYLFNKIHRCMKSFHEVLCW